MFTIFGIAHVARSPGTTINTCSEAVFKMPLLAARRGLLNAWSIIQNIYIPAKKRWHAHSQGGDRS